MEEYNKLISRIGSLITAWNSVLTHSDELFDFVVSRLTDEGFSVDQAATQAARQSAPNVIVVVALEGGLHYVKIDLDGDLDGDLYADGYNGPDCDTQLISESKALEKWDLDLDKISSEELATLRFVMRDGAKFYDEDEIYLFEHRKREAREKRYEEQRTVSFPLPDEFLLLCDQYNLTPVEALRSFIGDVCGIHNHVNHPSIPPGTDGYNSNGSDERDMAESYWKRTHWTPEVEEKHGISVH